MQNCIVKAHKILKCILEFHFLIHLQKICDLFFFFSSYQFCPSVLRKTLRITAIQVFASLRKNEGPPTIRTMKKTTRLKFQGISKNFNDLTPTFLNISTYSRSVL